RELPERRVAASATNSQALPFEGLRVADFTTFWAGPIVGHFLAALGAEVLHVESIQKVDGVRLHSLRPLTEDSWWEWSPLFHGTNTNKKSVTIDLSRPRGVEIAKKLLERCDVMVENFSPRVMEQLGLDYAAVRQLNPALIMVRMPAFGLTGPWRNRVAF